MAANVHLADFLAEYVAPYVTETENPRSPRSSPTEGDGC